MFEYQEIEKEWLEKRANAKCQVCYDDGYPIYGRVPHYFNLVDDNGEDVLTVIPRDKWPDSFVPDNDGIEDDFGRCGTYYCSNSECPNHKDNYKGSLNAVLNSDE